MCWRSVQTNIKRMLAYSSIAHAGYILVGLLAQNAEGRAGILFYVLAYTFMNLGAFGVLILLARRGDELNNIDDLKGLAVRQPLAAAVMAVFMFSLGGVPPSAGFMGKFYLFIAAIHAHLYGLSIVGLLASVIGAFYYLRVVYTMFFEQPQREFPTNIWRFSPGASVALGVSVFFYAAFAADSLWDVQCLTQWGELTGSHGRRFDNRPCIPVPCCFAGCEKRKPALAVLQEIRNAEEPGIADAWLSCFTKTRVSFIVENCGGCSSVNTVFKSV